MQPYKGCIPVVRLGGHREGDETGWQCAFREVFEETHLEITPLASPITYLLPNGDIPEGDLEQIHWQGELAKDPNPFLVVVYQRENMELLSLMYLAQATDQPSPSSEVKGLLLLKEEEIHRLCHESITLGEYIGCGGTAFMDYEFDQNLYLEPFLQLRLLSRILMARRLSGIE